MCLHQPQPRLPQLGDHYFLTDGGIETTLIFHEGLDLPLFAAFTLLASDEGREALRRYYRRYLALAQTQRTGFILDSATWRASRDWGAQLGYDDAALAEANRQAVDLLVELRRDHRGGGPVLVSGNIGPRGDGYRPEAMMGAGEAEDYHCAQVDTLVGAGVDMISAITMTHVGEAIGIARACARHDVPLALAFTVETDGRLPSGQALGEAIRELDADPCGGPSYVMLNCAHPDHFRDVIEPGADWALRIRALRANASRLSHAELDEATELDPGNPDELARDYRELMAVLPNLRVLGGCCGTDHRHVEAMAEACLPVIAA